MIRVSAPCRLHFGLFNAGPTFGGLGLMLDSPRVVVSAEIAESWESTGPLAERSLESAKRVSTRCHRIIVEQSPPQHTGLGVGTALSLATASAVILAEGQELPAIQELARLVGRGKRSGIGMHGFVRGGFLHDAGKPAPDALPELANRVSFPANWHILLVRPDVESHWHGHREIDAFQMSVESGNQVRLARPIVEAAMSRDLPKFGELLTEFNVESGRMFERQQGGTYSHPKIGELIGKLQAMGLHGPGQSSWGPTVFAFSDDLSLCRKIQVELKVLYPAYSVEITSACDTGATIGSA